MKFGEVPTYKVRIYISGPVETIEQTCRRECLKEGLCVTVTPTKFIYTGGEETGVEVGLINYPRFPRTEEEIWNRAKKLAMKLLADTFQLSVLVMDDKTTYWLAKDEKN